jgi:molybdopterin-guanine dinucleotide biosynthesis protein A
MKNMVIPTDTPFVTTGIYRYLISHAGPADVIVPPDHLSFFQPLCAVYAKTVRPAMKAQMDQRILGFTPLFNKVKIQAVPLHPGLDFYQENSFYNLNSPADLEAISLRCPHQPVKYGPNQQWWVGYGLHLKS